MDITDIKKIPKLIGEKIILNKINLFDAVSYYKLYVDEELNKYWGYDYHDDIKKPNLFSFYNMQKKDFLSGEAVCFAIRKKNKLALIGEVVLYNFTPTNIEVGFRVMKKYQNKGYGKEGLKIITEYIKKELKKDVVLKRYKENVACKNTVEMLNFNKIGEDGLYVYYKK